MKALISMAMLLPCAAWAGIVWQADFENGNLSEWDSYSLHPEHWTFPTAPLARSGQRCGRIELHDTDLANSGQSLRVEVEYTAPSLQAFEGSELYYAWSSQLSSQ